MSIDLMLSRELFDHISTLVPLQLHSKEVTIHLATSSPVIIDATYYGNKSLETTKYSPFDNRWKFSVSNGLHQMWRTKKTRAINTRNKVKNIYL